MNKNIWDRILDVLYVTLKFSAPLIIGYIPFRDTQYWIFTTVGLYILFFGLYYWLYRSSKDDKNV